MSNLTMLGIIDKTYMPRGGGLTYLLNDQFTTDESAPLTSPRTEEPGPGTWTAVQNDGQFSISGGELVIPAQTTPVHGDLGMYGAALSRVAGLAFLDVYNVSTLVNDAPLVFKATANVDASTAGGIRYGWINTASFLYIAVGTTAAFSVAPALSVGVDYSLAVILKATGFYAFIKGGSYTSWTLLWIGYTGSDATLYPVIANFGSVYTIDNARAAVLSAFADSSFLTDSITAPSAGNTFTHEADGWLTFDLDTVPSADAIRVYVRKQDSSNYWRVVCDHTGTFYLIEIVAGSGTIRGTAAGVLSGGEKIRVHFNDETITGYYNNTQAWQYASAANFKTETAGKVGSFGTGGAISNLETLPHNPSGSHLAQLNQIAAGS